ncbi:MULTISPECIES: flagellar brake protein [Cytobacillus]|uniref:Flagellar brake domain-containing protein n=1 Tax=Cytobacillus stercorigallinarum TaxID=2762240 RepID=A0ABR8QKK1_9BACI|nr:flagellar brake domain-containing protein [Cytobacillus stercorigallinarum]MBD7936045.1 flagellar brake domain-containing protein [Cytobacillus stercorigallinarum]
MSPGDQLYIEYYLSGEGKYISRIAEIEEDVIHIHYPVCLQTNRKMYLEDGRRIKCVAYNANGKMFFFSGRVVGRMKQSTPLLKIAYAKEFTHEKEQMREYVRVDVNESVEIQPIDEGTSHSILGISRNISAGGIAVVVNDFKNLYKRSPYLLRFSLVIEGNKRSFVLASEYVRKEPLADGRLVISFKFPQLNAEDRQAMMRFCIEQQLFHMKKSKQS